MNRIQPCAECGCPVLYHHPPKDRSLGPDVMVCEECTRETGRERLCRSPTA
ncbi:MAG TPA: hypothetical protein VGV89_07360 [Thermoplasmata archaeon]|nr:hypothetical protein [Thermoplasmata archaeon]